MSVQKSSDEMRQHVKQLQKQVETLTDDNKRVHMEIKKAAVS